MKYGTRTFSSFDDLTTQEQIKWLQREQRNLTKRLRNVVRISEEETRRAILDETYTPKAISTRVAEKYLPVLESKSTKVKDLKALSRSELLTRLRDIQYIESLKSSSVKGATHSAKIFGEVEQKLKSLSSDTQSQFWSIYSKVIEENRVFQNYKYEIFDIIIDEVTPDKEYNEQTVQRIINAIDYIEKQGIESKEQLKDAFDIFSINSEDLPFDV